MTDTTERADLVALADRIDAWANLVSSGYEVPAAGTTMTEAASALRRLAAQDQKPVAWRYRYEMKEGAWGEWTVQKNKPNWYSPDQADVEIEPLFASPPPAAGWDQAIEAAMAIAKDMRDKYSSPTGDQYTQGLWDQSQRIIGKIKALRANAPPDTGATKSADVGVGVPCGYALVPIKPTSEMIEAGCEHNPTQWNEGTDLGFAADVANDVYVAMVRSALSHQPAPAAANAGAEARLRDALEEARLQIEYMQNKFEPTGSGNVVLARIKEALSAHPHASDCDKQGEARCNARRCYDLGCFGLCGDETTKSEGGEKSPQDGKVGGSEQPFSAGTRQGRELPQSSKPKAECAGSISAAPLPSDRTANVTVELCSDCPPVGYETNKTRCVPARACDAFTVGRR